MALEDRQLLSTFTVTDTSDNPSDTGSLRYAINQANANRGQTINFGRSSTRLRRSPSVAPSSS